MESASFWYSQAMCLSKSDIKDIFKLAECLIFRKQLHRATTLLKRHKLDSGPHIQGIYLAAKAAHEAKDDEEALTLLENGKEMFEKAVEDVEVLQESRKGRPGKKSVTDDDLEIAIGDERRVSDFFTDKKTALN